MEENKLALVSPEELSLVDGNSLNEKQLKLILQRTPKKYIHQRPAKGGGTWDYVTGGYIKKCLNLMFGWDWDFEILDEKILYGEAIVKGKLTCRSNDKTIIKMQFGNKDIMYRKQNAEEISKGLEKIPLSIGNDLKAAATDCLKKCAAEIGISADIYNKEDFNEVKVDTSNGYNLETLKSLYEEKRNLIPEIEIENICRIIDNEEKLSYKKAIDYLKQL